MLQPARRRYTLQNAQENPFLLDQGEMRRDFRGDYISTNEAAEIYKVNRTQVWRYVKAGKLPHIVVGTADHPVYLMRREDVIQDALRREAKKRNARLRRMNRLLKSAGLDLYQPRPLVF